MPWNDDYLCTGRSGGGPASRCSSIEVRACRVAGMRYEILVDRTERPKKCSILPLAYRSDFHIVRFDRRKAIAPLTGDLLLHPDGVPLSTLTPGELPASDALVLSAVDCNWIRLETVLGRIAGPLPRRVRIPDGFQTCYLRRNKQGLDPQGGLATIEALFLASAFLGVWDESLLREYPMAAGFIDVNAALFESHGLGANRGDAAA
ncbi:MAG: hypothetical protein ABR587_17140 [Candidatus Binatia bacterium]